MLHPLVLEHPDWYSVYDADRLIALTTMQRLMDRAADEEMIVQAFHFDPAPGLGRVIRRGDGWRWEPIVTAVVANSVGR